MAYATFLLDFDHTFFDSDAAEDAAYRHTLSAFGVDAPDVHRGTYDTINRDMWMQVEAGRIGPDDVRVERFRRFLDAIGHDADPVAMGGAFVEAIATHGDFFPGARSVLERLAERGRTAMITNAMAVVQRARIDRLGLDHLFDAVVISAEVGASKPGREIYDLTFAALGEPARETSLMVGDSLASDIAGGHGYGIDTCWFNPTAKPNRSEVTPTHEIDSLDRILDLTPTR